MSIIKLVHSMSMGEKRHFTLYTGLKGKNKAPRYIKLFNYINNELNITDKAVSKAGFKAADKNFLKEKIEESLHNLYLGKTVVSKLKWLTESMERYFNNQQWNELKKCIKKTKEIALKHEHYMDVLQAIYWEKEMIVPNPDNKQLFEKVEAIVEEEQTVLDILAEEMGYTNLRLSVNALLLKDIRLNNIDNKRKFQQLISNKLLNEDAIPVSTRAKINYYELKTKVAKYKGNREKAYTMAKKMVEVFDGHPTFKQRYINWYKESICQLCDICAFSNQMEEIPTLVDLIGDDSQYFETVCFHGIKYAIHHLDEERGISYLKKIKILIEEQNYQIRAGRQLAIFYNAAVFFSLFNQWDEMHFWIEKILKFKRTEDRRDLQYGARILSLINQFELNTIDMDNQIQAVAQYFIRNNQYTQINQYVIQSFRHLHRAINKQELLLILKNLRDYLAPTVNNKHGSTQQLGISELYIWCISKIENKTLGEIYRNFK